MADRALRIDNHTIHDDSDCFVIAEIGHNHQGSVETCKELFQAAKYAGAQSVKLQKRDNAFLYTTDFYNSPYNSENAYGPTYGLHREALEFGLDEYQELQRYAQSLGLVFFATAFDTRSADFLAGLDVPCYKIASGDLTNTPLLEHVARLGKPMIVSTGAGTFDDVARMVNTVLPINPQLAILQCTATYPSDFKQLDLRVIETYRQAFPECVVGLSGHDSGIAMASAAYVLGARIVEKHFTLNRAMKGTDHAFSLEPAGMRKMVRDLQRVRVALGDGTKKLYDAEKSARAKMGKKIVAAHSLATGHLIQPGDLAFKSPGDGLAPYYAKTLYGTRVKIPLGPDDEITLAHVDGLPAETAEKAEHQALHAS